MEMMVPAPLWQWVVITLKKVVKMVVVMVVSCSWKFKSVCFSAFREPCAVIAEPLAVNDVVMGVF
jgi:hypothetical protein